MKKVILLLSSCCIFFFSQAQVTITANDLGNVGDFVVMRPVRDSVIPLGGSGANQTWNFSQLTPDTNVLDTVRFQAAQATSPAGTNIQIQTQGLVLFANKSTTQANVVGITGAFLNNLPALPINIAIPSSFNLTPTVSLIKFPSNLGSNFNENGNSQRIQFPLDTTLDLNGLTFEVDSVRLRLNYRINSNMDAWGTVTLPGGNNTYNCLRQRIVNTISFNLEVQTVLMLFGFPIRTWIQYPLPLPEAKIIQHRYWANNMKYPVLEIRLDSTESFGTSARYNFTLPTHLPAPKIQSYATTAIQPYPNPAQDVLQFGVMSDSWVEILDLQGKTIKKQALNKQQNSLPVRDLPSGMYLYRVQTPTEIFSGKWIKQ